MTNKNPAPSEDPESKWVGPGPSAPESGWPVHHQLLLGAALVMVGFLIGYQFMDRDPVITKKPLTPEPRELFVEYANAAEIKIATTEAIRGFMEAGTDEERCGFIVGEPGIQEKMQAFYARPDTPSPRGFGAILDTQPVAMGGVAMEIAMASEANQQAGWNFILLPLWDGMAIDWESSVGYGALPWPRFLSDQPTEPTQMRVYLNRVPNENLSPNLRAGGDFYEISARAFPEKLICRVPQGSAVADDLARIVPLGSTQPVNLLLKWTPDNSSDPTPEIVGVLHNFWVDFERWNTFLKSIK